MWQSKRIKHWLGSRSQNVIVNRKSGPSGSISHGVSEIALGPQITNCFRSSQAENSESVVGMAQGTEPGRGRTVTWATLRAGQANAVLSGVTSRGEVWLQPVSFCCGHVHTAAGAVQEHMLLQGKEEKQ